MTKRKLADNISNSASAPDYIPGLITSVIALAFYLFWALPFRAVLSYREQLQLFQTTPSYFRDLSSRPSGVASYLGEFLTQFFNNYWIGAAIMSGMMVIMILLCYRINLTFTNNNKNISSYILALLPPAAAWLFLGNPDVTLSFIVALALVMAGTYVFSSTSGQMKTAGCYLMMLPMTSVLYWAAGPLTIIFSLVSSAFIWLRCNYPPLQKILITILSLIWLGLNIYIWSMFTTYPLGNQLIGIGYLMKPSLLDSRQIMVEILLVAVPLLSVLTVRMKQTITATTLLIAATIVVIILFPKAYDSTTYRLIDYDYMVRANNWDGIIEYSNRHEPNLPLSVSATNLALGMTGQLDSRAFSYFQHGAEGLVPPFAKETLSSWTTGEIFFQLGMINSAQRFYFEGMEAIPNYNKSCRAIKRLAETAMIRGEYPLAEKYLHLLENTLFYKKWAQRNLQLMREPGGLEKHPFYGRLRLGMIDEQYMFSEIEIDKTLGQLFLKNPGNHLAKQYLITYPLLQRDLNRFAQYMGVVAEKDPTYNPLLAQQAIAFMAMKNGSQVPRGLVPDNVEQSLRDFAKAWTSKNQEKIAPYRRTLFHYLLSND